jgi:uncharacterized membrane protein
MKLPSWALDVFLGLLAFSLIYAVAGPYLPASFEAVREVFEWLSPPASVTGPTDATDSTHLHPPVAGDGGETG